MKKVIKWGILIFGCLVLFGFWYNWKYSMGVAESYTVNNPMLKDKLLIATQQSEYKDKVTKSISDYYQGKDLFVSVIDVTELDASLLDKYDAFVILHTCQMWKPPKKVRSFLKHKNEKSKIFTVCTSGPGDLRTEGVDGVSSASVLYEAKNDALKTIEWINKQFRKDT